MTVTAAIGCLTLTLALSFCAINFSILAVVKELRKLNAYMSIREVQE